MEPPLARYLRRIEQRSILNDEERKALLGIEAPIVSRSARYDFVRPGQTVDYACLVLEGIAGRFEQFANGERRTTALYVPGDMCDLHSVAMPIAGWGIAALTDATVAHVPHQALKQVADKYPALARAFWRDTVADGALLSKWVSVLSRLPAHKRLAHLLCEIVRRLEAAGFSQQDRLGLALTQEQIGEVLGMSAVHVQRIIKRLRKDGLIEAARKSILIRDQAALERLAEYDDLYLLLESKQRL